MSSLYSIGHGNKDIDEFINELISFNIAYLVDIRSNPYSKWNPSFNQTPLEIILNRHNIRYVYMGNELGGLPKDSTCYTNGHVDYEKISKKDFFIHGLNRLLVANNKQIRLAIMCSESDPKLCHRSKLIGQELLKKGITLNHIIGISQALSQIEVINTLTKGNGCFNLFGEETFLSRKSINNENIYNRSL